MANLNIPDSGYVGLVEIAGLSDAQWEALAKAIGLFRPAVYHAHRLERLIGEALGNQVEDIARIGEALTGLSLLERRLRVPVEEFLERLSEDLKERWQADGTGTSKIDGLLRRLAGFMPNESLALSAQAISITADLPNSFSDAGVFVRLQPIFYPNQDDAVGIMVQTSLKLEYFDGSGGARDVTFSLDEVDLDTLSDALEQAKTQISSSKELVKSLKVPLVPVTSKRGGE